LVTYHDINIGKGVFLREFSPEVEESELVWHRDYKTRNVTVIEGKGWKFQYDNELPVELKANDIRYIPGMVFHRIWRGENKLVLKIRELE